MRTLDEVKDALSSHKKSLFSNYPIKSLAIFGSYSRQDQSASSDLDVMVEFSDRVGIRFVDLADEIEKIVGLKVDLVSKKAVRERYMNEISNDLIYV